ncbi:hypothetical protein CGLO_00784 [Colletotrichum gloeosporioides Cg-14]|uniref:Uncharacterized protein n=1 Tax=Colletotrichum gloeosporioides (strain Cg-14) TaxID=1237896 RepID=T0MD03_COLGC|nr:hypothetical protein CGLO_00784 [Colletotrichum gloeosporioides Cg-14]
MLFTAVTSLVVGFAATLASAAPPNAAHAASDISDSCDTAISDKKCCFALTAKQDLGDGGVHDWGYVKATKTSDVFVGFDGNAYPQGFFCLEGETGFIEDSIGHTCDFGAPYAVFSCRPVRQKEPGFGTAKIELSDGSEVVVLTIKRNAVFRICPRDSKQSLFDIREEDRDAHGKGCKDIYLVLEPKTPDTCPK